MAVVLAALATPAHADDLTISASQNSSVSTATASNNAPGNVTIASGGAVSVGGSIPAITLNSSNTLTNGGTIGQSSVGGTALLIDGSNPIVATLVNNGVIASTGTGGSGATGITISGGPLAGMITSGTTGSVSVAGDNGYGVLVAAPFTGSIGLRSVAASGTNATAVAVTAPLTGSLSLSGTNAASGAGGYGILVAAPVSGTVANLGSISVGTVRSVDSSNNPVAGLVGGAGVQLGADTGGGFVNDRYYVDANGAVVPAASVDTTVDTLVTGSITTTGNAPAIAAGSASATAPVTIGAVGTGADAYAIVNRGALTVSVANTGLAAVGIRVGGGSTTTLAGGINSQANATISVAGLDGAATGIDLLTGARVPAVVNGGTMTVTTTLTPATSSVAAGPGGAAFGIVAENGAVLGAVTNTGTINVTAAGTNNAATVILDRSGTLASVTNSGTLNAVASGTGGAARAIDLTAGSGPVTVTNSGTITGDILLGAGPTTLSLTGGTVNGAIGFGASTANLLALSGTGSFAGTLTAAAPLNLTLADTARLDLTKGPSTLGSIAASGNSVIVVPIRGGAAALQVTGPASFTGASSVSLSLQSLAPSQNLTIIQVNGGITTDHLATLIDATSAPYLFTAGAPTLTGTTLGIALTRKTVDQIGLSGNIASLYTQSIIGLANAPAESSAIANLPDQASVIAAYRQISPPSVGRAQLRAAQTVADIGFGAAADRLGVVRDLRQGAERGVGIWAQELGDFARERGGANESPFRNTTFGLAVGVDTPLLGLDAVGVAFLSDWTTIRHDDGGTAPSYKIPATTSGVAPYAAWSWKALYVQATGLAAHVGYSSKRTLTIGSLSDTVTSDWHALQLGAGVTLGARLKLGRVSIEPSNSVSWTSLRQSHYVEQGAGAFALDVARQRDSLTTDTARLALAYVQPMGEAKLRFEAHGGYVHDFDARPTETVATFVDAGDAMTLAGDDVAGSKKTYGAAAAFTESMLAVKVGYDRREESGFHDQSVAVTAGIAF